MRIERLKKKIFVEVVVGKISYKSYISESFQS